MEKMVYLSERMFYQEGTTDAGYLDLCARLRSQLGGMTQVGLERCASALRWATFVCLCVWLYICVGPYVYIGGGTYM